MRKTFHLIGALLVANMAIFACTSTTKDVNSVAEFKDIMDLPIDKITCHNGGPGTTKCDIQPGIKIADFITIGCSVSCVDGYYACCGVRCVCKPDSVTGDS